MKKARKILTKKILVVGGAGYVGSRLVPALIEAGWFVVVYDLFLYGPTSLPGRDQLRLIQGDIRDITKLKSTIDQFKFDSIIHLACISNDPSFELNPILGKSINLDCFEPLLELVVEAGVERFIYASSSSVYGVKTELNVTEEADPEPITDYSKFKLECEHRLEKYAGFGLNYTIVRPATVCGYAARQRLDVVVNILTTHAWCNQTIKVLGGDQLRPNIHIDDMCRAYIAILSAPLNLVNRQKFNVGFENISVLEIAALVQKQIEADIVVEQSDDPRSYHINSEKFMNALKFEPKYSVEKAISGLIQALDRGFLIDPLTNEMYYNIRRMKSLGLV